MQYTCSRAFVHEFGWVWIKMNVLIIHVWDISHSHIWCNVELYFQQYCWKWFLKSSVWNFKINLGYCIVLYFKVRRSITILFCLCLFDCYKCFPSFCYACFNCVLCQNRKTTEPETEPTIPTELHLLSWQEDKKKSAKLFECATFPTLEGQTALVGHLSCFCCLGFGWAVIRDMSDLSMAVFASSTESRVTQHIPAQCQSRTLQAKVYVSVIQPISQLCEAATFSQRHLWWRSRSPFASRHPLFSPYQRWVSGDVEQGSPGCTQWTQQWAGPHDIDLYQGGSLESCHFYRDTQTSFTYQVLMC